MVGSQASTEGSAEIASGRANSQQRLAAICEDLVYKGNSEASEGFWSGACVAADKAIVQWVKVPPCQLPDSGT